MQSSKSQILAALKRQGRCSVDELAAMLGLAPMTVRQHLATLERDALVTSSEERQRLGRPHFVYSLTEKGEESFHRHYDRLASQLLHEVGRLDSSEIAGLTAAEKTALLFDKLADRFIARHGPLLEPLTVSQRVVAIADLLQSESGFAESAITDAGYEIRDYNCFYRQLNGADGETCRWHQRVLNGLLGCPVRWEGDSARAAHLCRFVIPREERAAVIDSVMQASAVAFAGQSSALDDVTAAG